MGGAFLDDGGDNTISFARKLAESPRFKTLFRDGMTLVEEVAAYLDGPGRQDARTLTRPVALAYAAESMRLTTRLMQLASWLLVQRAVNEGEMTPGQAEAERTKVRLSPQSVASGPDTYGLLPETLRGLTDRSLRLQARLIYLDRSTSGTESIALAARALPDFAPNVSDAGPGELGLQWEMIRVAFNGR